MADSRRSKPYRRSVEDGACAQPQPLGPRLTDVRKKRKLDLACDYPPVKQHLAKPPGKCYSDNVNARNKEAHLGSVRYLRPSLSANVLLGLSADRENWLGDGSSNSDPKALTLPLLSVSDDLEVVERPHRRRGLKDRTNTHPGQKAQKTGSHMVCSREHDILVLREALRADKEAFRCLQIELEEERNASSSAANEAMAMIARLQEEKAAILMEARQFKRMAEERELHNQEAIALLKEMVVQKEEETFVLENDLAACKHMLLSMEHGGQTTLFDSFKLLEHKEGKRIVPCSLEDKKEEFLVPENDFSGCRNIAGGQSIKFLDQEGCQGALVHYVEGTETCLISSKDSDGNGKHLYDRFWQEEGDKSGFKTKRKQRGFNGMDCNSVRSNLVSFFDQAREGFDDSQQDLSNIKDLSFSGALSCAPKNTTVNTLINMIEEDEEGEAAKEFHLMEKHRYSIQRDSTVACGTFNVVVSESKDGSKVLPCSHLELAGDAKNEIDGSVWERIVNLKHLLDAFSMSSQHEQHECGPSPKLCSESGFFGENVEAHGSGISNVEPPDTTAIIESPTKSQCLIESNFEHDRDLGLLDSMTEVPVMDSDLQHDHSPMNIENAVQDVYEIGQVTISEDSKRQKSFKRHETPLAKRAVHSQSPNCCLEKPALTSNMVMHRPSLLLDMIGNDIPISKDTMPPIIGIESRRTSNTDICTRNEVELLTTRLQVLENEKLFMAQAIESLRKKNKELRMLQDIAQQVQDLKSCVNTPTKRLRLEPPRPFLSFLKGLSSLLLRSAQPLESNLKGSQGTGGTGFVRYDSAGLTCVLENTPKQFKRGVLMVRGVRLKIPC